VKTIRTSVSRREVIETYAAYDRSKKAQPAIGDFANWNWDDPASLDQKLASLQLKPGVLAAYKSWWFVQFCLADLLDSAVVSHIFRGQSQTISTIVLHGLLETWSPPAQPSWYAAVEAGNELGPEQPLVLRPSVASEKPAKWYIEDGSGRALCLVRRILRFGEFWRVVYCFLGAIPDPASSFIRERPELLGAV
jgi:hypothetical protein